MIKRLFLLLVCLVSLTACGGSVEVSSPRLAVARGGDSTGYSEPRFAALDGRDLGPVPVPYLPISLFYSRDGRVRATFRNRSGQRPEIEVISTSGTIQRTIGVDDAGSIAWMAVSPSGRWILYVAEVVDPLDNTLRHSLRLVRPDGSGRRELLRVPYPDQVLGIGAVDPSDTMVAYSIQDGTSSRMWVKPIKEGPAVPISSEGAFDAVGEFSPDGSLISLLTFAEVGGTFTWRAGLVGVDGSGFRMLGITGDMFWGACFAPDGRSMYVTSSADNGETNIVREVGVDGTVRRTLTSLGPLDSVTAVLR